MKIGKAKDVFERRPFLKVAIVGQSGSGKTSWAARAPRPLIILTEPQGMASIREHNEDALTITITTWAEFRVVFEKVKLARVIDIEGQPALEATFMDGDGEAHQIQFQTLVIDSFTDLQRMSQDRVAGTEDGKRDRLDFDAGAIKLDFEKWGMLTQATEAIWRQQRALACNVIAIFLAEDRMDSDNVKTTVPMLFGSKLPFAMGQYFNAVGLAQVRRSGTGDMQHIIRWKSSSTAAIAKPAPGWPNATLNTTTPGETTLGSLLKFSYPGLAVASEPHDDAAFVAREEGASQKQAEETPADTTETTTTAPRRRR